uniref:Uncharacterized protein LOC114331901 n=1 Tax=Diabrotica virgifera virgifera TaxID=50390 RepID=A0A6P7FRH8_DIAVI
MFLNTLGVKDWVIKKWAKIGPEENVTVQTHQNSGNNNHGVKQLQIFFDSLPKLESHYCRATSSKLYLEPIWTSKSQLYKFYKSDFCINQNEKAVSIATFHKVFEKNKLSLYRPKKKICAIPVCPFKQGIFQKISTMSMTNIKKKQGLKR